MQKPSNILKPIRTKTQYQAALDTAYDLMQLDLSKDTAASDQLEVLTMLIEQYESRKYPIPPPHPIEAIKFRLEQLGKTPADLAEVLGYRSRVSEILNGKRKLNLDMIRALHEKLHIPLESLIARY
jgi:HTH-type transcriptional regulator / antitoxin HigA